MNKKKYRNFCPRCGAVKEDYFRFCVCCGARVSTEKPLVFSSQPCNTETQNRNKDKSSDSLVAQQNHLDDHRCRVLNILDFRSHSQ